MATRKKTLKFEECMAGLEDMIKKLEGGKLSLEEQIAAYEDGIKLSQQIEALLDDAEKRVLILNEKAEETVYTGEEPADE